MATYFESGVGKAILHSDSANSAELGRLAATEALAQIKRFQPSLALAFVSPELEIAEVSKGINDVLDGCPLIVAKDGDVEGWGRSCRKCFTHQLICEI